MSENTLPAGYVDLGTHATHIANLRHLVPDVDRFMRYLPHALKLQSHAPGSPEAFAVFDEAAPSRGEAEDFIKTINELAVVQLAAAEELQAEAKRREVTR